MENLNLFNELSDYIITRNYVCDALCPGAGWEEEIVHPSYALWVVTSGLIHIRAHGREFCAGRGDVVFFYPDRLYTVGAPEGTCGFVRLHFDFAIGNQRKALSGLNLSVVAPADSVRDESRALVHAVEALGSGRRLAAMYLKGCILMLIAKLAGLDKAGGDGNRVPPDQGDSDAIKKLAALEPAIVFINRHMYSPFTVKDIAASVSMSEKYFSTYFKNILGVSPAQYVMRLRMNRAREYLYEGKFPIKEIANRLGYPDQYSFSKAFKKYFGVAPSKFKREQ